jgi:hypothetical protein
MKRVLIAGIAALALLSSCKSPFDVVNDQQASTAPFRITATVNGSSFTAGGTCNVQPWPQGGDMMSVSATQVNVGSTSTQTITLNLWAASGKTAPFTGTFGASPSVATYTDGSTSSNTYSTENAGSGTANITYWQSNASGTGYAEGTFSFIAKKSTGETVTVTGGTITKN